MEIKCHYIIERGQSFDLFYLGQYLLVLDDVFIGGQQDIELPAAELRHKPAAQNRSSLSMGETQRKDESAKPIRMPCMETKMEHNQKKKKVFLTL